MPGYIHYDFGDTIRTGTNRAAEDEPDPARVSCDMALLEAFARGFLEETGPHLTPREWETLSLAGKTMTFIIGLRFLTDYLQGDTYFKTHRPDHNRDRCRAQFALVADLEKKEKEIERIISSCRR